MGKEDDLEWRENIRLLAKKLLELPDRHRSYLWEILRKDLCMTCGEETNGNTCWTCFESSPGD